MHMDVFEHSRRPLCHLCNLVVPGQCGLNGRIFLDLVPYRPRNLHSPAHQCLALRTSCAADPLIRARVRDPAESRHRAQPLNHHLHRVLRVEHVFVLPSASSSASIVLGSHHVESLDAAKDDRVGSLSVCTGDLVPVHQLALHGECRFGDVGRLDSSALSSTLFLRAVMRRSL